VLDARCLVLVCNELVCYSIASCDETTNHIATIIELYPELTSFKELDIEYDKLGRKINNYLQYVEESWRI
jgi:hypothetical protein